MVSFCVAPARKPWGSFQRSSKSSLLRIGHWVYNWEGDLHLGHRLYGCRLANGWLPDKMDPKSLHGSRASGRHRREDFINLQHCAQADCVPWMVWNRNRGRRRAAQLRKIPRTFRSHAKTHSFDQTNQDEIFAASCNWNKFNLGIDYTYASCWGWPPDHDRATLGYTRRVQR